MNINKNIKLYYIICVEKLLNKNICAYIHYKFVKNILLLSHIKVIYNS